MRCSTPINLKHSGVYKGWILSNGIPSVFSTGSFVREGRVVKVRWNGVDDMHAFPLCKNI